MCVSVWRAWAVACARVRLMFVLVCVSVCLFGACVRACVNRARFQLAGWIWSHAVSCDCDEVIPSEGRSFDCQLDSSGITQKEATVN